MLRFLAVATAVLAVTVALIPVQWIAVRFNLQARRRIPVFYHRCICALVGVRVRIVGERTTQQPLLIVSNHVSWLDISVISAIAPVIFVAKSDVSEWPLIGLLARLQRTVFVDRERRHKTREATAEIARRMTNGDPVVLFGEGTSSDGNRVLPFRTALVGAARDALLTAGHVQPIWLQPLSIAYTGLLGLPLGRQHRSVIAWYGDAQLLPHLIGVCRRGAIDVVITWGEPIAFDETSDRKVVARSLETEVRHLTTLTLRGRAPARQPPQAVA